MTQGAQNRDRAVMLIEEVIWWAIDPKNSEEVECTRTKLEPLIRYISETSEVMVTEVLLAVAKAMEAGFYFGKHGFPEERIPNVFKKAFREEGE